VKKSSNKHKNINNLRLLSMIVLVFTLLAVMTEHYIKRLNIPVVQMENSAAQYGQIKQPNDASKTTKLETFTDNRFGYQFSYPSDWKYEIMEGSTDAPEGFPYISKDDGSYKYIVFAYFKEKEGIAFDKSRAEKTEINGLAAWVGQNSDSDGVYYNTYTIEIAKGEYVSAILPVNDPAQKVTPESEDVKIAEKIVRSFRKI
jgi:hypothetical protein